MNKKTDWLQKQLKCYCPPLSDVETSLPKRWESGMKHHPESIRLMKAIECLDLAFGDDYFCWKTGGDGDNGEILMYLLDIYFEAKDKVENI